MLTDSQRKTLEFIRQYHADNGYAPKLQEIADGIGIRSRGVVHRYVQALVDAGFLRIHSGRHRGIELLDTDHSNRHSLPLLGKIAAGQPIEAIPDQDTIDLADYLCAEGRYAIKVQGDSMIEAGILDGDIVIIEARETAENGHIVVALIDEQEATLKRYRQHSDGTITLIPENSRLYPMTYPAERVRIQGVVVGQIRSY